MQQRDPLQFIQLAHASRGATAEKNNETLFAAYSSLSAAEAQRVAAWALDELLTSPPPVEGGDFEEADDEEDELEYAKVLLMLACLVPDALQGVHGALAAHGIFYPPILYRGAGNDARDRLLAAHASAEPGVIRQHMALALAWIGDLAGP